MLMALLMVLFEAGDAGGMAMMVIQTLTAMMQVEQLVMMMLSLPMRILLLLLRYRCYQRMLTELSLLIERGSELAIQMISRGRKKNESKQDIYTPHPD